jgi:unsaturated rhamnogalacturonyl hydrolase
VKEVAQQMNVPMIDMFEKSKALVMALGDSASRPLYLAGVGVGEYRLWDKKRDQTHFTRPGAVRMASLAVEGIRELHLPLAEKLLADPPPTMTDPAKVVGLDEYFNSEWAIGRTGVARRAHYVWEDSTNGGFSNLARILDHLGADLDTLQGPPTGALLDRMSIYMIVDPDTPAETDHPHFIDDASIDVVVRWVERGGVLVLMGNDAGNSEFEHLNRLAGRFGIQFNEDSEHRVEGTVYETGANGPLPDHPMFQGVRKIFMKGVSTLRVQAPAEPILTEGRSVLMASARVGRGLVFAVGDPWLYNEYTPGRVLPPDFENALAARGLMQWLLGHARAAQRN